MVRVRVLGDPDQSDSRGVGAAVGGSADED